MSCNVKYDHVVLASSVFRKTFSRSPSQDPNLPGGGVGSTLSVSGASAGGEIDLLWVVPTPAGQPGRPTDLLFLCIRVHVWYARVFQDGERDRGVGAKEPPAELFVRNLFP